MWQSRFFVVVVVVDTKKEFKNAHQKGGLSRFSLSLSREYLFSYFNIYWERGKSREKKRFLKRVLTVARLLDRVCVEVDDEN